MKVKPGLPFWFPAIPCDVVRFRFRSRFICLGRTGKSIFFNKWHATTIADWTLANIRYLTLRAAPHAPAPCLCSAAALHGKCDAPEII
jgi:hypothetical protein